MLKSSRFEIIYLNCLKVNIYSKNASFTIKLRLSCYIKTFIKYTQIKNTLYNSKKNKCK